MNLTLILLLICPILIPLLFKIITNATVTWKEYGVATIISVVVVALVFILSVGAKTHDVQVLNGEVINKQRVTVSCEHSYSCNCRTVTSGSGKNQTTSTVCDTCYEHTHDYSWVLFTNIDEKTINIERVDRQGVNEPPRFSAARVGEPVAITDSFTNYVKAAPESLFNEYREHAMKWAVPAYPNEIYDYHRVDRVLSVGAKIPNADYRKWSNQLSDTLKALGPNKQANVVILVTDNPDPRYTFSVKSAWLGGKQNDVVLVVGVPDGKKIAWAGVFSWSKNGMLDIALRDSVMDIGDFDFDKVLSATVHNVNQHFQRRSMDEYAYLKSEIKPATWVLILAWILSIGLPTGLCIWMHMEDLFGEEGYQSGGFSAIRPRFRK